jgi:thiol-disulfide isomerase/thioredoxin
MKYTLLLLAFAILALQFHGQKKDLIINTGDKLPDAIVKVYAGNHSTAVSIAQLRKGQYLILDFFASWCAPCIGALPELNRLAADYGNQLKIVPVTDENLEKWQSFAAVNQKAGANKLPCIVGDKQLSAWFPHRLVPHEVWIDNKGIVRYITYGLDVNEANIKQFIQGKPLVFAEKKDDIDFDYRLPLVVHDSAFLYRSMLTAHNSGLPGMSFVNRDSTFSPVLSRMLMTNHSLVSIFYYAYRRAQPCLTNYKTIELDVSDSTKYVTPFVMGEHDLAKNAAWYRAHTFCYDRIVPKKIPDSVFFADVLKDLNAVSPIKGTVIKKKKRVWLLINTKQPNPLLTSRGGRHRLIWNGNFLQEIQATPMPILLRYLNSFMDAYWVIDESGIDQPLDMVLNISRGNGNDHLDIPAVQESLRKYGLDLVAGEREIDVLYLTDKPTRSEK